MNTQNTEFAVNLWTLPKHRKKQTDHDLVQDIVKLLDQKDEAHRREIEEIQLGWDIAIAFNTEKCIEISSLKAEIDRLQSIEQGSAEEHDCGWNMKFPGEECRNCGYDRLKVENSKLREALLEIKKGFLDPGVAVSIAEEALTSTEREEK